jgi:hypothetical protein
VLVKRLRESEEKGSERNERTRFEAEVEVVAWENAVSGERSETSLNANGC